MSDKKTMRVRGIAVYPNLLRPDTKYNDLGTYKADIKVDPSTPKGKAALDELRKVYKEHTGKVHPKAPEPSNKNALYYLETDRDTGEETGMVVLKLRVKNKENKKTGELWDRRPAQFDAKGKPLAKPLNVWGGSVLNVNFEVYCWSNKDGKGVSLQPLAVQIIELVTGAGRERTASDYGFEEEDGYSEEDGGFEDETDGDDDSVPSTEDDDDEDDDDDEADY